LGEAEREMEWGWGWDTDRGRLTMRQLLSGQSLL